jgi:hypothetical protein
LFVFYLDFKYITFFNVNNFFIFFLIKYNVIKEKMIIKPTYLIRKLFQQEVEVVEEEEIEDGETEIEILTKLVPITKSTTSSSMSETHVANNTNSWSTHHPLSTLSTLSDFEKNKEIFNEAAKKLKGNF